jgi:DNA polymerase-3 subunit alpha
LIEGRGSGKFLAMSYAPFVPLRVMSSYSMLEGAIDPKAIARLAKDRGFPAIAICDRNGLYGAIPFASAARELGIQPLIGALLGVQREAGGAIDALALYAQNDSGWLNLCHLVSRAHLERPLELEPHVRLADLAGHSEGLIALTGAGEGALARLYADGKSDTAQAYCDSLQELFAGRLYIELARRGDASEEAAEGALIDLAYARGLPLVASNPANYAEPGFHSAHDALPY